MRCDALFQRVLADISPIHLKEVLVHLLCLLALRHAELCNLRRNIPLRQWTQLKAALIEDAASTFYALSSSS